MNPSSQFRQSSSRDIPAICGLVVIAIGGVGIAGWLLHLPALVQVWTGFTPMQFNTAAGFVAAGIGLTYSTRARAIRLFTAAFLLVLGVTTLLEYATGLNLLIDGMLFPSWLAGGPYPGRMGVISAGCFAILGLSCGLSRFLPSEAPAIRLTGSMALISMAGAELIASWTGLESAYRWGQTARMAAPTAAGFLILGSGGVVYAWRALRLNRSLWLAGIAGLSAAAVTVVVWNGALADHQLLAGESSRAVASAVARLTTSSFQETAAALARFADRSTPGCREQPEACERDLATYFRDLPELTSLEWVERTTGNVIERRAAPGMAGRDALESWRPAIKNPPVMTLVHSVDGSPRIIVSAGSAVPYFVVASFNPALVLSKITAPLAAQWNVSVTVDSKVVLAGVPSRQPAPSSSWRMNWLGGSWIFRLSPGADYRNSSNLPDWILLGGMTATCFFAITAYLWQAVRERIGEIEGLNAALETRVAERTSDLVATNDALRDVAEKERQSSILLRRQESQLEGMFAGGRIGAWSRDLVSGKITWRGPTQALLGLAQEEIPATFDDFLAMVHPGDIEAIHLASEDVAAGRTDYNAEFRVICKNGGVRWLASQGAVTRDENGVPLRIEGIHLDISARKEAEIAREQSEQQLRQLADSMPHIVWAATPDGKIDYYNRRWHDYSGQTFEQTKEWGWQPLLHPDDLAPTLQRWTSSFTTGEPFDIEYRFKRASDNTYRWHLGRAVPVRNSSGEIVRWFGTGTDIEDYKRAEAAITGLNETLEERVQNRTAELATANHEFERTKGKLQSVLDAATQVSIIATDTAGTIDMFNSGATRMLQYRADEMVGIHTPEILHDPTECRLRAEQILQDTGRSVEGFDVLVDGVREGKLQEREWTYIRKDGSSLDVTLVVTQIRDKWGTIVGFLGIASDITAHKSLERELRLNNEKLAEQTRRAEEGNRTKSDFLATMSHEIRTPMNAILGMADLLWESDLNAEQRPYVEVFRRAGSNLLVLINDILDLSKIEAGHFELERVNFSLEEVVYQAIELVGAKARVKGVGLMSRIAPVIPLEVVGDPERLRQVLINLLGNAIKFTEAGEIVLTLLAEETGNPQRIQFSVSDTGIGIPADKLATIFDNFTQADSSVTRRYGGTGLGLSISRRIVELMGGELTVTSTVGRGSTFRFTLALDLAVETAGAPSAEVQDLEGRSVLVLDDNATNRLILCEALCGWGLVAREFSSPSAALLELTRAIGERQPYSLVIIDKRMPEMDGFTATSRIREISSELPVIMLSSDSEPGDSARRRAAAINGYASKPVRRAELFRLVCNALGMEAARPPLLADSRNDDGDLPAKQSPLRILVVEDAADNRLLLQAYLKPSPYVVTFAEDGQAAVNTHAAAVFDMILMDIQMPVMDGLTATRAIRERERISRLPATPIVALTANARPEDIARSIAAGCDGHLTKPISKQRLLAAIEEYGRRESSESPEPAILIEMPEGLQELVPGYLAARKNEVPEMLRLLAASDFERLRVLGHNLKGNGTPYGFPRLAQFGATLEQSAKKRDAQVIQEELLQLENYLSRVELMQTSH